MIESQNKSNGNEKRYWRSLEEFHGTPQLDALIDQEFGNAAPPASDGLSRRHWLQIMGASMAFGATLTGCRYPAEKMAPFAFRPAGRTPGVPRTFSTMLEFGGIARPVVATSYDGRPIKLDGNPDHPDSGGGSDTFTQATILELYDPDRSRDPVQKGDSAPGSLTWGDAVNNFKSLLAGPGAAVLSEPVSSPTLRRLRGKLLAANPDTRWFEFTSVSNDNSLAGSRMAFGADYRPVYHLDAARIVVTLDADPLGTDPASIRLTRDFMAGRDADHGKMNRLYSVESDFSKTGAVADHRLPLRFAQVGSFLAALESLIDATPGKVDGHLPYAERVLAAIASDLFANQGAGVVMVGASQPAEVHARAFRINSKLGNIGKTVSLLEVADAGASGVDQLKQLTELIGSGAVSTLLILGGNPVFYAPSDLKFADALQSVTNSVHLSVFRDETSRLCDWHLNASHPLECWGDGISSDGSTIIAQPLLEPLFNGWSAIEFLAVLTGEADWKTATAAEEHDSVPNRHDEDAARQSHHGHIHSIGLAAVQETHLGMMGVDSARAWQAAVRNGFIEKSAAAPAKPALLEMNLNPDDGQWKSAWSSGDPELIFRPSASIYDGRFGNNGWLQELPDFVTKLTWDNAALVNPVTADALQLEHGKVVNLKVGENTISLPVYVLPGLANGTVCTWLGYGRTAAGRVAGDANYSIDSVGSDIRPLRTSGNWWSVPTVTVVPTSTTYKLASTQDHFRMDALGRDEINRRMAPEGKMIREGSYSSYEKFLAEHPIDHGDHDAAHAPAATGTEDGAAGHESSGHAAHWPQNHHLHFENFDLTRAGWRDEPAPYKWGMSIDLNKCTGCGSCVIACQAENNIPVVGKDQVSRGREMQWMRIDRYFITDAGDEVGANPAIARQPVACQQCESAPCETVCPVAATTHSDEGLNDMVYNRCIGTRYCGNNCPYKVRRFNYYNYTDAQTFLKLPDADRLNKADLQLQSMMMNPEVTVRSRGVMEKCTYCVQRIQNTKIVAKTEGNRRIRPNEIRTACQDACPAQAILFGDIQDPVSDVARAHRNPRAYALLEELNIAPRTRYLARVRNPHPDLESTQSSATAH
jgi:molybdopterin-containing oxidoreductase family iron-sulfur binding subunit